MGVGDEPPRPIVAGALGDIGSALFATTGALAALRHRKQTGLGERTDARLRARVELGDAEIDALREADAI